MSEIRVEHLTHVYSKGTPFEKTAIDSIDLVIPEGQIIAVIGHTGSGKSTFIQHLNALLAPSSGTVYYAGKDINADKLSRHDIKFNVGMVFQYPEYQLFEETIYKDIAFGPSNMKLSEQEIEDRVREAASFVSIPEAILEDSPIELSGGQKRRVAIAGVIAMRPGVLVLDEPTAGLDPEGCKSILDNICKYKEKTGATVIFVSHNMDDVARIADRIIVFDRGKVVMDGSPAEVFLHAEKLMKIGLGLPKATELALALKQRGLKLDGAIYTHQQLLSAIKQIREGKKC